MIGREWDGILVLMTLSAIHGMVAYRVIEWMMK